MGIGRVGRVGRVARVSKGGEVLGGHDILTMSDDINPTVTTAQPHGLVTNDEVVITGTSNAAYNSVSGTVLSATTATTFLWGVSGEGAATGGRWDRS